MVASVHSKLRMPRGGDDRADADGRGEPARRRARPLHRAAWSPATASGRSRSSTPTPCSRPAPRTGSRWRSTPGPSGSTRRSGCCGMAIEAGCLFTIDTDAHAPGQLDWLDIGCSRAAECGVPDRARPQHVAGGAPAGPGPLRPSGSASRSRPVRSRRSRSRGRRRTSPGRARCRGAEPVCHAPAGTRTCGWSASSTCSSPAAGDSPMCSATGDPPCRHHSSAERTRCRRDTSSSR